MNEIEKMFYDAFISARENDDNGIACSLEIIPQVVLGIYQVDFVVNDKFVIEIDGYEYHKTKEQREKDYTRERYLLRKGFTVIRFTGTEVFLSCHDCAVEAAKMIDDITLAADYEDAMSCFRYHEYMKQKEVGQNG